MTAAAPARNTVRRQRTREALVAAAESLFAARGPDAVSIDEIVAAADVAKGSFYNHFTDKDDLARAVAREVRSEVERKVDALNAGVADPAARVARALCVFFRFAQSQPARARTLAQLFEGATDPDAPLNRGVRSDVGAGLACGRFTVPARDAAILYVIGVVQAGAQRAASGMSGAAAAQLAANMAALLLGGLGLKAGEAETVAREASAAVFKRQTGDNS